ncbi:MAG: SGNH/GDSL hydrolase family protein [Polyangiales bacterium]
MERILPFGDSITYGYGFSGGWRRILGERLRAEGIPFAFVGTKDDPYGRYTATVGISSSKAANEIADALASGPPTITVQLLGSNDVYQGAPTDFLFGKWKAIADAVLAAGSRLVACTIPPMKDPARAPFIAEWNRRVRAYVVAAKAAGSPVVLCDLFSKIIPEYHLSPDGVHPNGGGYSQIASAVYDAAHPWLIAPPAPAATSPSATQAGAAVAAPAPQERQWHPSLARAPAPQSAGFSWKKAAAFAGVVGFVIGFTTVVERRLSLKTKRDFAR